MARISSAWPRIFALAVVVILAHDTQAAAQGETKPDPKAESKRPPEEPTAKEQLFVYLLNKARSDPAAYGKSIGLNLDGVALAPPLAVNTALTSSARFRAGDMLKRNYFGHVDPDGQGPNKRALESGYPLNRLYSREAAVNNIESISVGSPTLEKTLENLIVDSGVPNLSHRKQLLCLDPFVAAMREIGVGFVVPEGNDANAEARPAGYASYCAVHTAHAGDRDTFVTGVVYEDKNGNGAYDEGEGLEGAIILINTQPTATLKNGGYAVAVKPGPVVVGCHKGTFQGQATAQVSVDTRNIHVEFISGKKEGLVNFGKPIPAPGKNAGR
ncbi:MAG: CAP domain-containing protein [Planctomycetes bacterium]|nr:CAP domain-containing protein [Planctomycetota bacterium]